MHNQEQAGKQGSTSAGKKAGRKFQKPKLIIKHGEAARVAKQEEAVRPLTTWSLMVRFLPIWILLILILIVEPTLPFRAVGSLVKWVGTLLPESKPAPLSEPVFIVEGAQLAPISERPTPNWSLEVSAVFTPEVQYWKERVAAWSVAYRVKPNMIATLMQIESCGNPQVTSGMGAMGLFQVLPLHFSDGDDPFDPDINAGRGLLYFGEMLASANGDTGLAFAAYNGGPSILTTSPADWPKETQDYQFWASGIYEEAERRLEQSPTLHDWLDAGGRTLCEQAAGVLELVGGE